MISHHINQLERCLEEGDPGSIALHDLEAVLKELKYLIRIQEGYVSKAGGPTMQLVAKMEQQAARLGDLEAMLEGRVAPLEPLKDPNFPV